jgi:hypothetical protein
MKRISLRRRRESGYPEDSCAFRPAAATIATIATVREQQRPAIA